MRKWRTMISDTQILYMSLLWTHGTYITSIMKYKQQWAGKPDVIFFYWIYLVFQTMRTDQHALTRAVIYDFLWSNLKRPIITFKMTLLCDFCVFDHANCELLISGAYFLMREWKCFPIQFQIIYDLISSIMSVKILYLIDADRTIFNKLLWN